MIPLLKKARSRYLDHEVPTNTGTACHLRIQLYECPSVSGVQLHQLDGDIRRQRKGLLGRKVARKLWAIKRLQYHTSIVWYPAPRPCRRAVLACRPQQHAAIPRLVFGAGLAGTPPPLPHSNAVDSSGQHQGPHAVDGGGDADARAVSGGDADARAVSSRRADPACAGPGDALPSFSMRPTQHPKRTAEQAVAAGQGGKGYSKPWTVVVFLVLPHMLLCRQSWLWCVAASGCLLSLHYILHIAFGCVLQCLVPPCTPQPVCRHRGQKMNL